MIEPRRPHFSQLTWSHLLLFLLLPAVYLSGCADAQSATVPTAAPSSSIASHSNDVNPPVFVKAVALLCAFIFISIFSVYLNHWTMLFVADRNQTAGGSGLGWRRSFSPGIGREVLNSFPILEYSTIKDLKIGKGALECAVCLSEFKDYESLRLIPKCNHLFHPECIDAWLASHVTCPVCRANLKPDSGEVAIGVPTQLNANELDEEGEENSGSRGEARETEQHAVVELPSEGQTSRNSCETDRGNMDEARGKQSRNRRSTWRMFGKLPRSNSTGHSLVEQPGKNWERNTLRLPEDVRMYILLNHATIGRSASYNVVMPMKGIGCWSDSEGSSRSKRNSYIERQDRRVLSLTPPIVPRKD